MIINIITTILNFRFPLKKAPQKGAFFVGVHTFATIVNHVIIIALFLQDT